MYIFGIDGVENLELDEPFIMWSLDVSFEFLGTSLDLHTNIHQNSINPIKRKTVFSPGFW